MWPEGGPLDRGLRPAFQQYPVLGASLTRRERTRGAGRIGVRAPAPPVPAAPSSRAARGGDRGLSGGGAAAGGDGGA